MSRPFAVFDIDGTLIRWQLYHAIVDTLAKQGHLDAKEYAAIKDARRDWKMRAHPAAFRQYEHQLVDFYQKAVVKLNVKQFEQAAQLAFDEYKDQVYAYTRDLIAQLKKQKYLLFAISASQSEVIEMIGTRYGFDDFIGAKFLTQGDRFTGKLISPYASKDKALRGLVKKHDASWEDSVGVGDSRSDVQMLELVETPIAFNPERELFKHAKTKGWKIVVERKNMIYELEKQNGRYQLVKTN